MDHAWALRNEKHCKERRGRQILVAASVILFILTIIIGIEAKQLYPGNEWLLIAGIITYCGFEVFVMTKSTSLADALMNLTLFCFLSALLTWFVLWPARPSPIIILIIPLIAIGVITFTTKVILLQGR